MKQIFNIEGSEKLKDSREKINENFSTLQSGFAGTSFPTENLVEGQRVFVNEMWYTYLKGEWKPDNQLHNHNQEYLQKDLLQAELDKKSNTGHTHDERYYTETEMNTKLAEKASLTHIHDDRYPTVQEFNSVTNGLVDAQKNTDTKLTATIADVSKKSYVGHTHTNADITTPVNALAIIGGGGVYAAKGDGLGLPEVGYDRWAYIATSDYDGLKVNFCDWAQYSVESRRVNLDTFNISLGYSSVNQGIWNTGSPVIKTIPHLLNGFSLSLRQVLIELAKTCHYHANSNTNCNCHCG